MVDLALQGDVLTDLEVPATEPHSESAPLELTPGRMASEELRWLVDALPSSAWMPAAGLATVAADGADIAPA